MGYSKVSVLIPTRKRLERLNTLLASFESTVSDKGGKAELVFRIDDDDVWTNEFLAKWPKVVGPRCQGYASMPRFYNELAAKATGDVLMCGNDDMVFETYDWAGEILRAADSYPDGVFDFGYSTLNETHFPFATVSRKVVDRLGFIWDPRIFWGDIYLRDVMRALDRAIMLPQVKIAHDWAGHKPDEVYRETLLPKSRIESNSSYWTTTHTEAVNDAISKLREAVPV